MLCFDKNGKTSSSNYVDIEGVSVSLVISHLQLANLCVVDNASASKNI